MVLMAQKQGVGEQRQESHGRPYSDTKTSQRKHQVKRVRKRNDVIIKYT